MSIGSDLDPGSGIVWRPTTESISRARVTDFARWLQTRRGVDLTAYDDLHAWSVEHLEEFWGAIWDYFEVSATPSYRRLLSDRSLPGAKWFEGARLNYAEHVLRGGLDGDVAVLAVDEDQPVGEITWGELRGQVGALAEMLQASGVQPGDRVAGYLPNITAAVVGMLATTGIGAIWTSVAPDFGTQSVLDRLQQLEPTILLAVDGYRFNGRSHSRLNTMAELRASLPSVDRTILVRHLDPTAPVPPGVEAYDEIIANPRPFTPEPVDASDPLWVLFSSGTTGKPKGIVQSHGGILLEHFKALGLGMDLGPGDTYFFHSSTSWMAWNFLVSGLLHRSRIVVYSGSPSHGSLDALWRVAGEVGATVFGMGSAYVGSCAKADLTLDDLPLQRLRTVIPTGSPLPMGGWRWLSDWLPEHTRIDPICGGTDVCSVFFGGSPVLPVKAGKIPGRWLGIDAHAWDEQGHDVVDAVGEFVVTSPMPSMPLRLWGDDAADTHLRSSYFNRYPGVWTQGDWIAIDDEGAVQVLGRSDATLNRGGVRLGSAEIYTVVESMPEIADSLVVGVELEDGDYYMPLFLVTKDGASVDDELRGRLNEAIRHQLSPRHLPDEIVEVPGLPRTLTGKKLEIPVKRILQGTPAELTVSSGSPTSPDLLRWFEEFARSRNGS